jgi:hypothetical protein
MIRLLGRIAGSVMALKKLPYEKRIEMVQRLPYLCRPGRRFCGAVLEGGRHLKFICGPLFLSSGCDVVSR